VIRGPWLGDRFDRPDAEPDGQPHPHALGDDLSLARLLQLGETQSGSDPKKPGIFGVQHAGGGKSWCHAML